MTRNANKASLNDKDLEVLGNIVIQIQEGSFQLHEPQPPQILTSPIVGTAYTGEGAPEVP
jgi:hypothetical protein